MRGKDHENQEFGCGCNASARHSGNRNQYRFGCRSSSTHRPPLKISMTRYPPALFAVGDGRLNIGASGTNANRGFIAGEDSRLAAGAVKDEIVQIRHGGFVNRAFFDGHVEKRKGLNYFIMAHQDTPNNIFWFGMNDLYQ